MTTISTLIPLHDETLIPPKSSAECDSSETCCPEAGASEAGGSRTRTCVAAAEKQKPLLTLDSIRAGQRAVVKSVSLANRALCAKLLSMGIVSGTAVEVLRIAPLGDPIKIEALGYKLALRMSEAKNVLVEAIS